MSLVNIISSEESADDSSSSEGKMTSSSSLEYIEDIEDIGEDLDDSGKTNAGT